MGYILKLTVILLVVSGIAAGALALVNLKTKPVILEFKRVEQERAREEVMKEGVLFKLYDDTSDFPFYRVYSDEEGTDLIGYIFTAIGKGYSSDVVTITAVDTSFNVVGIKVTSQQETPGLGTKVQEIKYGEDEPWFQRQFFKNYRESQGKGILNALTLAVDKDGGEIHSITGATISGRAISKSIKDGAKLLQEKIGAGK